MKIVSITNFSSATAAATTAAALTELGEHAAGDWIFVCMAQDGGGTAITSTGAAGWSGVGTQGAITGTRGAVFHKQAASASETVPTFSGATDEWTGTVIVIRGLDATTAVAAWQRVDWTGVAAGHSNGGVTGSTLAASSNGGAAITYSASTMALVFAESDTGPSLFGEIGALTEVVTQKTAVTVSHMVGYALLQGSGTVPDYVVRSYNATEGGNIWTLLLTPADADDLLPFASADADVVAYLGDFGALHDQAITWSNITTRQATLDGVATNSATITRSTAAVPIGGTPFNYPTSWSCNVNLGTAGWVGEIGALATAVDVSGKVLALQWRTDNTNTAPTGDLGIGLYLEDGSGNWSWFSLRNKTRLVANSTQVSVIDPATGTREDGSGTLDLADLKYFGLAQHRLTGSTSSRGVAAQMLVAVGVTTLVGGGASDPTGWQAMASCLSSWGGIDIGKRHSGASDQFQIKTDMAIGDGTHSIIADFSATSCAYPGAWDPNTPDMPDWNCGIGSRVVELVGGDASSINLGACLLSTDSAQALNLSVSPSFSGTILTDGATLVGFDIAWDASQSLGSATIRSSPTAAIGGTTLNSTTIRAGTEDALATVSNGFTANNATFVAEGATYGLRVAAAGTLNINAGTTFYGFTKDIDITATTGAVTIALAAGVPEPTYQTAGAAVDVTAPPVTQSVAITGLAATYRLQIFDIEYDLTVSGISVTPAAGATYTHNGITWTVRSTSIVAGAGTITVYGTGTPSASGTLAKASGTGDASVTFSAYVVDGTELYIGVPAATSYTWTDSLAATAPRVIRVRVMEDGPGTADAILMIDAIVGLCGVLEGEESVGYLVAAVADDVYNDRGVDGSMVTGITIDDSTLRLEIASGTIVNYNGTDVLVIDGRDIYAYETYWLGTTAGMRDQARFIEAVDAVNFRCSNFKLLGTSGYPIMIRNCYMVDSATGIFASLVDYSGDPISNAPDHMAAIVVTTSGSVVTGTPETVADAVRTELATELADIIKARKFAQNKKVLDPVTGVQKVYDDDGSTILGQGNAYMDADGTELYDGNGPVHRTERLT